MKLVTTDQIPLIGEMRKAMEDAKKLDKELGYFDLTSEEYAQIKEEMKWPEDAGEVPHFWSVELRVDGIPTRMMKGNSDPQKDVLSLLPAPNDPTQH